MVNACGMPGVPCVLAFELARSAQHKAGKSARACGVHGEPNLWPTEPAA